MMVVFEAGKDDLMMNREERERKGMPSCAVVSHLLWPEHHHHTQSKKEEGEKGGVLSVEQTKYFLFMHFCRQNVTSRIYVRVSEF